MQKNVYTFHFTDILCFFLCKATPLFTSCFYTLIPYPDKCWCCRIYKRFIDQVKVFPQIAGPAINRLQNLLRHLPIQSWKMFQQQLFFPRVFFADWYHLLLKPSTYFAFKHSCRISDRNFYKSCKSDGAFWNSKFVVIKSDTFSNLLVVIKSYKLVFLSFLCVSGRSYFFICFVLIILDTSLGVNFGIFWNSYWDIF